MKKMVTILGLLLLVSCGKNVDSEVLERCVNGECAGEEITVETQQEEIDENTETNNEQQEQIDQLLGNGDRIVEANLSSVIKIGSFPINEDLSNEDVTIFEKEISTLQGVWRKVERLTIENDLSGVTHGFIWQRMTNHGLPGGGIEVRYEEGYGDVCSGGPWCQPVTTDHNIGTNEWLEFTAEGQAWINDVKVKVKRAE